MVKPLRRHPLTEIQCNWDISNDPPTIQTPNHAPKQTAPDPTEPPSDKSIDHPLRISYVNEQTSHHPPVSAYYAECPERGLIFRGFDQISAKFTGTAVRVTPGIYNHGIFVTLKNRGNEEYQMTHPIAHLGGLLKGALSISVADTCFITCPKTKIKAIMHYVEEGWIGSAKNRVNCVVYNYDPEHDNITKLKDVPEKDVLAKVEGCWREQIYYTIPKTKAVNAEPNTEPTSEKQLLIDLVPLMPVPKIVPEETDQLPNESRRFWKGVTDSINTKQYSEATRIKQELEERQREKTKEREAKKEEWKPRFFTGVFTPEGKPELTEEGQALMANMQKGNYHLEEPRVMAVA